MTDNIVDLDAARTAARRGAEQRELALALGWATNEVPGYIGTPEEWLEAAISHLRTQSNKYTDAVGPFTAVSRTALQIVLQHLDEGRQPPSGGKAA